MANEDQVFNDLIKCKKKYYRKWNKQHSFSCIYLADHDLIWGTNITQTS